MYKKLISMVFATIFTLFSSAAMADGSTWGAIQNSPAEDDNVIGTVYAEKSWALYEKDGLKASPFLSGSLVTDTKDYDWNNKLTVRAGGKLNYQAGPVALTLRGGVAHERLFNTDRSYTEPFLAAEYWVGWGFGTRWPGSSWGVIGNTSPSEKGNVIAMVYAKQGFLAWNAGKGRITPFVDLTVARDTKDLAWNNKEVYSLGVEYVHPVGSGSVNVGAKFQREERSGRGNSGAVAFVTYWFPL
jgi:hypothetical protein